MKIAIASSLQGPPEETSPGDPLDTQRLGEAVARRLADLYPHVEIDLLNREDFPGQGDAYLAVRRRIVQWGADIAVHIHQDASRSGGRGWSVLYCREEALSLAKEITAAMRNVPSPFRGIFRRCDVAVLKAPPVSVLVEAGFYTSPEDEAIGVDGWANPIVRGIMNYLAHKCSIFPKPREEDEEMVDFEKQNAQERGQGSFAGRMVDVYQAYGRGSDWLHVRVNTPERRPYMVFFVRNADARIFSAERASNGFAGDVVPLVSVFQGLGSGDYGWVTLHVLPEDSGRLRAFIRA